MTTNTTVAASRGTSFVNAFFEKLRHAYVIRRRRKAFARLADLDQSILDDIGLTRADIYWGLALPIEENAAVVVRSKRDAERRASR